jgi:hypothetical protein
MVTFWGFGYPNKHVWLVVCLHLWKIWVRQLGWFFPKYGKIKFVFQTTNQMIRHIAIPTGDSNQLSKIPQPELPEGILSKAMGGIIGVYMQHQPYNLALSSQFLIEQGRAASQSYRLFGMSKPCFRHLLMSSLHSANPQVYRKCELRSHVLLPIPYFLERMG